MGCPQTTLQLLMRAAATMSTESVDPSNCPGLARASQQTRLLPKHDPSRMVPCGHSGHPSRWAPRRSAGPRGPGAGRVGPAIAGRRLVADCARNHLGKSNRLPRWRACSASWRASCLPAVPEGAAGDVGLGAWRFNCVIHLSSKR